MSDIEGKATRVGASERGQRVSFKVEVVNQIENKRSTSHAALFVGCRENLSDILICSRGPSRTGSWLPPQNHCR
jgi:hypothetical protein